MPNLYQFRDRVKAYRREKLLKAARFLYENGFTSNRVSILGLFFGVASAFFLFSHHAVYVLLILLNIILDNFDGTIARKIEKKKGNGWLVDVVCDRTVTISLLTAFYLHTGTPYALALIALLPLTNLFFVYGKLFLKKDIKMIHLDSVLQILFIFSWFELGIYFLLTTTTLNFFFMLFQRIRLR